MHEYLKIVLQEFLTVQLRMIFTMDIIFRKVTNSPLLDTNPIDLYLGCMVFPNIWLVYFLC